MITLKQPNGLYVDIEMYSESMSAYTTEDFEKDANLRGLVQCEIHVYSKTGFTSRYINKTLYWDNKGLYTYKKQKEPFYYWTSQNIEEDYEHWSKNEKGYSIPLNEPRKTKKNIF